MVDPNRGQAEARRRHEQTVREWAELGHPATSCVGHTHPLPGCQAPEVHAQMFPPQTVVPKVTAFSETAALWAVMNGDLARAREIVSGMSAGERGDLIERLTALINLAWAQS